VDNFKQTTEISASYLRNFVFGVEDSLVSTAGLLSGIAITGMPRNSIFVAGIVLIFVEAFSMAVGSFLSERSAAEYIEKKEVSASDSVLDGIIMFFSYFISGFIPLFPYIIMNTENAFWFSIVLSLIALFLLGVVGAKISGRNIFKSGFRMAIIGGIAIGVGITVGRMVNNL